MAHSGNDPGVLTTVVGSYPAPVWLQASGSRAFLRDAVLVALKAQELAGIDVVSDGELGRFDPAHPETNGMIDAFIRPLAGVRTEITPEDLAAFRQDGRLAYRTRPAGVVSAALGPGTLDLAADLAAVRDLTDRPLKFTVTSPYMLAQVLLDQHYRNRRRLAEALAATLRTQVAALDAAVVQLDEANLTGHPEDWPWAVEAMNRVLGAVPGETAVHLCFGNYGGQTVQRGFWRDLVPFFNALEADHVVLEFARRGYDELEAFRDVKTELRLGLGVIDIKDNEVEAPEVVAARIEHAVSVLGADRIRWVHPDCGLWMLARSVADRKLRSLVRGRDLFLGKAGEKEAEA
jgi:5-methyltetrahydropteroyltriglutamate--homocysteine methyltransferase